MMYMLPALLLTTILIGLTTPLVGAGPTVMRRGAAELVAFAQENGGPIQTTRGHYIWNYDQQLARSTYFNNSDVILQISNTSSHWIVTNETNCQKQFYNATNIDPSVILANATLVGSGYIRGVYVYQWRVGNAYYNQSVWIAYSDQYIVRWEVNVSIPAAGYSLYTSIDYYYTVNITADTLPFEPPYYCPRVQFGSSRLQLSLKEKVKINHIDDIIEGEKGWGKQKQSNTLTENIENNNNNNNKKNNDNKESELEELIKLKNEYMSAKGPSSRMLLAAELPLFCQYFLL